VLEIIERAGKQPSSPCYYRDLGADYLTKRDPERAMRRMQGEANALG
jgi:hypothetical protein